MNTESPVKDKYDEAIEYLTANPDLIGLAWDHPYTRPGGCLFAHCSPRPQAHGYGCLTQVKSYAWIAYTPELTDQIKADSRLPSKVTDITVDSLPVFAEYQRRMDKMFNR